MTESQLRFLAFHTEHMIDKWQWHFLNSQLRAHAGKQRVTIWRRELDELIGRGLMFKGQGAADVHVTDAGRAECAPATAI